MVKLIIKEINFSYSKRHLFDMLDLLVEKYNWQYVEKDTILSSNFKDTKNFTNITHLLLITGSSQIKDFIVPPACKISYIIDDLHTCGQIKQARINNYKLVYKIYATYAYCFNKFYPMIPINMVEWFPHSARFIIPFNNNPINKILVSGRINKIQYPNRFKIVELSKKDKFIIYYKPQLNGYRAKNKEDIQSKIYGEKYYKLLNKYLINFTCDASLSRPYLVAKHFEILGSGSLLFTCNPNTKKEFEKLGFIDGEDYISCTPNNMIDKINWLKNNYDEINRIRKNGYEKVKKHTWTIRTEFLNNQLN
ncbi:hypothetical protein crov250 [Cafeteria roenbergensis virus]|uniref:Spore protein YkvP/CgeB glycosyl transferase-like domain-containing protein n=1 Tax=Cafeteria roenbergensis virus (strain BV-PW1) TaxID=693272 RepID=E3T520_CROVB|nr:hypothetical protein crov250 [Cafeteria roenbergensis virus BV-PW1]ADO67283.1 hypothetical protein crov250 [Cafeteria roenbergensis virus BV-PW1]